MQSVLFFSAAMLIWCAVAYQCMHGYILNHRHVMFGLVFPYFTHFVFVNIKAISARRTL